MEYGGRGRGLGLAAPSGFGEGQSSGVMMGCCGPEVP